MYILIINLFSEIILVGLTSKLQVKLNVFFTCILTLFYLVVLHYTKLSLLNLIIAM